MGMFENADSIREKAQAQVPAPLLAVGIVQPAGTWGSFGVGQISPLAGLLKQKKANKAAGDLNTKGAMFKTNRQTLLGLTADTLYAFETKLGYGGMKILGTLATWPRADLVVSTAPGKVSSRIVIDRQGTSEHYELEATTGLSRGFNDALLAEIVKPMS